MLDLLSVLTVLLCFSVQYASWCNIKNQGHMSAESSSEMAALQALMGCCSETLDQLYALQCIQQATGLLGKFDDTATACVQLLYNFPSEDHLQHRDWV
jgi:hypothetical protein